MRQIILMLSVLLGCSCFACAIGTAANLPRFHEDGIGANGVSLQVFRSGDYTYSLTRVPLGTSLRVYAEATGVVPGYNLRTTIECDGVVIGSEWGSVCEIDPFGAGLSIGTHSFAATVSVHQGESSWVTQTSNLSVTVFTPTVTVEDATVVVGGQRTILVVVRDGETTASGVKVAVDSIDSTKATATISGSDVTDLDGQVWIRVSGVATTAGTPLVVKTVGSNILGTGQIKVVAPVVTVPNTTVVQGGVISVDLLVTDGALPAPEVVVEIDTLDTTKATAVIVNDGSKTDINGKVKLRITGVSLTNGTPLKIKATVANVVSEGVITVVLPIVTVGNTTVLREAEKPVTAHVTDGTFNVSEVNLAIHTLDATKASASFPGNVTATDIDGSVIIIVRGIDFTGPVGTPLIVNAPVSGATGQGVVIVN